MTPRRSLPVRLAGMLALAWTLAACVRPGPPPRTADEAPAGLALEILGVAELAKTTAVDAAPVGGLSALAWQPSTGFWLALSDDRGDFGPPRIVALGLDLAGGRLDDGGVEVVAVIPLAEANGSPLPPRSADPEGLALSPGGTLWVSSEGDADRDVPPWLRELDPDGVTRRVVLPPAHFLPAGPPDGRRGVRFNFGFEALAVSPDGRRLYTSSEAALAQDGPLASFGVGSRARLLVVDAASGRALAEHVYEVEPLPAAADPGGLEVGGLVELLALDDGRLLALERTFAEGRGNTVRLYVVDLAGADDVTGAPRLPQDARPVEKSLLLDFADLDVPLDNVEGMALGPALADGRRALVFVSDDNFSPHQRTLFYAFALSGGGVPPVPEQALPVRSTIAEIHSTIAEIQGAGHRSPLVGRQVEVEGVVTAVAPAVESNGRVTRPGGFWIEDPAGDGDPATSEGLWVSEEDGRWGYPVAPGDRVRVLGRVAEIGRPGELTATTLLTGPARVATVARGAPLPGPRRIGSGGAASGDGAGCPPRPAIDDDGLSRFEPAVDGIDWWESLEGMRVELAEPAAVGPASRFGEIAAVAAACAPASGRTARGGLLVAPDDFHPERIHLDDRLAPRPPQVATGDRFAAPVVGVVDYSFGNFKLVATGPWPAVEPPPLPPETTHLAGDARRLTLATLNVENLSARDGEAKFAALAGVIVDALGAPAILALQEVQDDSGEEDDGTVAAGATLDRLTAAVEAAGGPRYLWRQIDPEDNADGGAPGGNIRVAFLLDPARVRPVDRGRAGPRDATAVVPGAGGRPALSLSPGRIAPTDPAFAGGAPGHEPSRKPLALEAEVVGDPSGRRLFLVAVHFRSKGGDDPLFGAVQPPRLPSEPQRTGQAEAVAGFVRRLLAADPAARIAVLGDFNDFSFRPPLAALAAAGLVDLVERLPEADRYTYVYEGNSQVLDHLLVSPALAAAEAGVDAVHLHADFPPGHRASDHDPVVARFRIGP